MKSVERIAVVGAGVMGNGIAQVVAQAGFEVDLVDVDEASLERAHGRISRSLERLVKAGHLEREGADACLARIATTTDLAAAGTRCDHLIEAVPEVLALKHEILAALDAVCAADVIFATNTSQFAITAVAAGSGRPDRVIGTHWFNPPPVMRLIEVVRGSDTSDETLALTVDLAERYGKETIVCKRDTQGFVTARLASLLGLEAMRLVEEGIASVEDVNKACRLAFNHAMGPIDMCDLGGLDTALLIAEAMERHYGDRYRAPQNLRELVNAGHLGRKTGRGFSAYEEDQRN